MTHEERIHPRLRAALVLAFAWSWAAAASASAQEQAPQAFGGVYADLTPRQKALVDDLCERFGVVAKRTIDPQSTYDKARLSVRTTFEAVTHALGSTDLTDAQGDPLGNALDLIEHLEAVRGKTSGAGSDQQFRIYVRLKEGALDTLKRCRQFTRKGDNTVFHKGYPTNYRGEGGVPSMQISIALDGRRADVDVDYRSSKFPAALLNGHLSSANSDVRAGNNLERHDQRWEGLSDWWSGVLNIFASSEAYAGETPAQTEIAFVPRIGKKGIGPSVSDFLTAWLVEGKPEQAMGYVSARALSCLALEQDPETIDHGVAPVKLLLGLRNAKGRLGEAASLAEATLGVRLTNTELTVIPQKQHAQFVLYGVPDPVAEAFDCANRARLAATGETKAKPRGKPTDFRHYGVSLRLRFRQGRGSTLLLLWAKESGYWKIVSYEVEVDAEDDADLASVYEPPPTPTLERVAAPPGLVEASTAFLDAWLVRKDVETAWRQVAPSCYPCVDLFPDEGELPAGTLEEQKRRLRSKMETAAKRVGRVARLEDFLTAAPAVDPENKVVMQPRDQAFSLVSLQDRVGVEADCARRLGKAAATAPAPEGGYGTYYATAFRFKTVAGEPAVLYLGWTREGSEWRMFAYDIVIP